MYYIVCTHAIQKNFFVLSSTFAHETKLREEKSSSILEKFLRLLHINNEIVNHSINVNYM